MKLKQNQYINICVRALIFEQGQLLLTEWANDKQYAFLIGGRVDFGEALIDALYREVAEEVNAQINSARLVYFGENIYPEPNGRTAHEYGWYFLVELDRQICQPGQIIPNPDHPKLFIRHTPVTEAGLAQLKPDFLRHYLPQDFANHFEHTPRFVYNNALAANAPMFKTFTEFLTNK
jgi:8-oxo-dGTP pyrophosphatase MutT (NUDIX family)